jgi:peptidoglycan/LPS O-acetylase OafA/YrhL
VTETQARPPFITTAPKLGLVSGFDGFRGIGMFMILIVHSLAAYLESWATLVDSFFVLSGFLITTLLLQEVRSTGTINLRKFYLRRATRLLPSVWLFGAVWLVISGIATAVGFEPLHLRHVGADVLAALAYVYHLFFPNGLAVIEPEVQQHRTMWHLWTLSVEEWFYFFIAGTALVCARRRWIKQLGIAMGVGFVAVGLARWFAYTGFFQDNDSALPGIRMAFVMRPDGLMLGMALAVFNAHLTEERIRRLRRPAIILANLSVVTWFVTLNLSSELIERLGGPYFEYLPATPAQFSRPQMLESMYWFRFGHTICMASFAVMTFALVHYRDWWLSRFWSLAPFQWIGRLSYTLYIWHALPFIFLFGATGGAEVGAGATLMRVPFLVVGAFLISIPVYYLVEMPVLRLKLRYAGEAEVLDRRTGMMVTTGGTEPAPSSGADTREPERPHGGSAASDDGGSAALERAPGEPGAQK